MNKIESTTEKWIEKGTGISIKIEEYGWQIEITSPTPPRMPSSRPKSQKFSLNKLWSSSRKPKNQPIPINNTPSPTKIARNLPTGNTMSLTWSTSNNLTNPNYSTTSRGDTPQI